MLKTLLKAKIDKAKDIDAYIDEILDGLTGELAKKLKKDLKKIIVFTGLNSQKCDKDTLKELIKDKIDLIEAGKAPLDLAEIYEKFAENFGDKKSHVPFNFDKVDLESIKGMKNNFYFAKDEASKKFNEALKHEVDEVFHGKTPRNELAGALKAKFNTVLDESLDYFHGVGDNIMSQSRNIATINQGDKYGVKHYQVMAVMDSRTSSICRSMNGRIIPASHLQKQTKAIARAKNIDDKINASAWLKGPFNGKDLPSNVGLPPYHFRCRTQVVPVWVEEHEFSYGNEKFKVKNTGISDKNTIFKHIDKLGVERVVDVGALKGEHKLLPRIKRGDTTFAGIKKALNSIEKIAPSSKYGGVMNTLSSNGYFIALDGNRIVTAFKATDKYFKKYSFVSEQSIIKSVLKRFLKKDGRNI